MQWNGNECGKPKIMRISTGTNPIRSNWRMWNISIFWKNDSK
jgi:hypothetical protein